MLGNGWYGTRSYLQEHIEAIYTSFISERKQRGCFHDSSCRGAIIAVAAGLIYEHITNKMKDDPANRKMEDCEFVRTSDYRGFEFSMGSLCLV